MNRIFLTFKIITKILMLMVFTASLSALSAKAAGKDDYLVLSMKTGDIVIKLRPDLAPNHVERIKKLTREGAYDRVIFHRVIDGFMAQTGDVKFGKKTADTYNPALAGTGGASYPDLKAEFSKESFKRGTVGMARSFEPDSANSQFFICFEPTPSLNHNYTIIGEVVKGMENVDKIKKGDAAKNGSVTDPDEILMATLRSKA